MPASRANSSLWADSTEVLNTSTSPKDSYDVAIIGGGFSGLWSAFHLKKASPALRIAVFEARKIGFGASGRNGGWVSSDYPVSKATLLKRYGTLKTEELFQSLNQSIDEIGEFALNHAQSAGYVKSGSLYFARNAAQLARLRNLVDESHHLLDQRGVIEQIRIDGVLGGVFNPNSATINPFQLLIGIGKYLLTSGVEIFEDSQGVPIPGGLLVNTSAVKSPLVIQATEAFGKPGREFIPLYSLMVATEPLPESFWNEVGNSGRFTFAENSHLVNYAQRTSDNRLAIGGRGATYPFASRLVDKKENTRRVHEQIKNLARSWFPDIAEFEFTHQWGGPVAITRDWEPYVIWDENQGFGRIGGYAGDGVTMSHLAAKLLVNQILKLSSTHLHFVNRQIRNWEFEPLRYFAVNTMVKLSGFADAEERITRRPSQLNRIIEPVILR